MAAHLLDRGPRLRSRHEQRGALGLVRHVDLLLVGSALALAAIGVVSGSLLLAAEEKSRSFPFKKDDADKVPAGWKVAKTGTGEGSVWKVVADESAPSGNGHVLAQTAESPGPVFNLCIADEPKVADLEATVSFSALAGKKDQGGGLVWRFQDANNYYVARMNPLESNYRLYKVVDGARKQLATVEDLVVKPNTWHRLTIRMKGDKIECLLDSKKLLTATDTAIQKSGKVGFWTKADAVTAFADLKIGATAK